MTVARLSILLLTINPNLDVLCSFLIPLIIKYAPAKLLPYFFLNVNPKKRSNSLRSVMRFSFDNISTGVTDDRAVGCRAVGR